MTRRRRNLYILCSTVFAVLIIGVVQVFLLRLDIVQPDFEINFSGRARVTVSRGSDNGKEVIALRISTAKFYGCLLSLRTDVTVDRHNIRATVRYIEKTVPCPEAVGPASSRHMLGSITDMQGDYTLFVRRGLWSDKYRLRIIGRAIELIPIRTLFTSPGIYK